MAEAETVVDEITRDTHVRCPYCAEDVLPQAVKCKHCGSNFGGRTWFSQGPASAGNWLAAILSLAIPGLGQLLQNRIVSSFRFALVAGVFFLGGGCLGALMLVGPFASFSALIYTPKQENNLEE